MKWYFRRGFESVLGQSNFDEKLKRIFLARRLWRFIANSGDKK